MAGWEGGWRREKEAIKRRGLRGLGMKKKWEKLLHVGHKTCIKRIVVKV